MKYTEIYPINNHKPNPMKDPALVVKISPEGRVNLLHRKMNNIDNKWHLVQFNLSKEEFQNYINKLQEVYNSIDNELKYIEEKSNEFYDKPELYKRVLSGKVD
jgi:hypothetical protein